MSAPPRMILAATVAALAAVTARASDGVRGLALRPFNLSDFITDAQFDGYDTHPEGVFARQIKLNFTARGGPGEVWGEISQLGPAAYELHAVWRVSFDDASGSAGAIHEYETGEAAGVDVGEFGRASRLLCRFAAAWVGVDAALSAERALDAGTTCVLAATAVNDTRRAHLTLQVLSDGGSVVRAVAAHRRELTGSKGGSSGSWNSYILIGVLLAGRVAIGYFTKGKLRGADRSLNRSPQLAALEREANAVIDRNSQPQRVAAAADRSGAAGGSAADLGGAAGSSSEAAVKEKDN